MTEQQLAFARRYEARQMERFGFAQSNVEFHQGYIEDLAGIGIEDESVDVVISNCVINLSPFKDQVFAEIARVLKPGGELYFSDIFSDRRVPPEFYDDPVLRGECLSGALYIEDFRRILAKHGIHAFYDVETAELHVGDFQIATKLGCIGFASHTVRAIKCADLEDREENYGQVATYLGTMPENKRYFDLTEEVRFIKGKPLAVSGNMAAMLSASRYAPHFEVRGTREHHVGTYDFASAQEALALRRGKEQVGLARLEDAHRALGIEAFDERVHDKDLLRSAPATPTMQVNVSYRCNLACTHCYLECGPQRTRMHGPRHHGRRACGLCGGRVLHARRHRGVARNEPASGMVRARGVEDCRRGDRAQQPCHSRRAGIPALHGRVHGMRRTRGHVAAVLQQFGAATCSAGAACSTASSHRCAS